MNFRAKTSLTIGVLTALALGVAFAAVAAAFNGLQRQQLDASLRAVADDEAADALRLGFSFSSRPGPAANDVGPLTKYGVIFDVSGKVLSATPPFDTSPPPLAAMRHRLGEPFDLRQGADHMRGVVIPIPGDSDKRLFLATSREDLDGDEVFLFKAMLTAFAVSVLWVAMVAHWLGGRLTRDHEAIASVVRAVAGGNLGARIQLRARDPAVAQLARDINDMVEQLSKLMTVQERFIAHAAHELRSPLAALHGELQQSLRRSREPEAYRSAIAAALVAAKRLIALADDLLALARVKAALEGIEAAIDLQSVADAACAGVATLSKERGVRIGVALCPRCRVADRNGDTARVFRNVLENAIYYSPDGGLVRIEAAREGNVVRVAVTDSGPGVRASERERIFEPFFRGQGSTPARGTGLGLGIAREIARSHGGDLTLDSSGIVGACFVISLPIVEDALPAAI
jgi:two-component system, OmpR family, sensor kinase